MFAPDRRHFHHRLVDLGLKQHHVVILIYVMTLLAAGLGMFMMVVRNTSSLLVFLCILLMLLLLFRIVGSIRLRETITGLRRKYALSRQVKEERSSFEAAQLDFRRAETFEQWWLAVSKAADRMEFLTISLPLTNRDGTYHKLTWRQDDKTPDSDHEELLKVSIPIQDRRTGPSLNLKAEVCRNGSLESAGRRVALFARLIDEYNLVDLPRDGKSSPSDSGNQTPAERRP